MAVVNIDIGSGKRATLSSDGGSIRSAEQRAAVSEILMHWPKYPGLLSGATGYLRDLGLAGSLSGDPVAALRAAIEDGRVSVSIDKPVARGGAAGGSPSTPPFPKANRLASVPGMAALPADKALPSWATPSDVSAGELMSYLESVVSGAGAAVAGGASSLVDSTPLGDAAPFSLDDSPVSDALSMAAVDPFQEEQCFARYEIDMEMCAAAGAMYKDPRTYAMCSQRAFAKYQTCRGM
ncbi:hypothetical protein A8F72_24640 [Burkholderia cenocepacia]|nr:hypothetical protein A8F32_13325 [Burkholderia cenocepacia]ONI97104.1 hypothetical protein A8F33_33395 [Burkholderia cenocepacia]ONJ01628.1 hypothetical protein A8F53_16625 [Burkholderia cenocepacia]ONJ33956.1 hypothetical protein A8F38_07585 [Burkholderia cenocepacia]ONY68522.1 hypothetical protein A8F35_24550 [Burkholderia cenocepacia]